MSKSRPAADPREAHGVREPERQDVCKGCGKRPTCAIAEAAILVVARDFRGEVTSLCARCGAGEDAADQTTKASETP